MRGVGVCAGLTPPYALSPSIDPSAHPPMVQEQVTDRQPGQVAHRPPTRGRSLQGLSAIYDGRESADVHARSLLSRFQTV